MDIGREIPFYFSTQFADLADNPRAFFGYAHSLEEAEEVVRQYEAHTGTKFVGYRDVQNFGKPLEEAMAIIRQHKHYVRFSDKIAEGKSMTPLPLQGSPFIIIGKKMKECQFGRERRRVTEKNRQRIRTSKKVGCSLKIVIRDVLVYPQYKAFPNSRHKRNIISDTVKDQLDLGIIRGERRFYINLPNPQDHVGHDLGQQVTTSKRKERELKQLEKEMMDLTFLGTASCFPTPKRAVSSTVFRHDGECWMFDCGEGTQVQLMKSQLKASRITKVFITHLHGDHLFGLPGMLCTMGQNPIRAENNLIQIYGPIGLRKYLRVSLEMSRSTFDFSYVVHELLPPEEDWPADWDEWHPDHIANSEHHPQECEGRDIHMDLNEQCWVVYEGKKLTVKAAPLTHRIPCFGYVIQEKDRPGKLKARYLKDKGIPPGPLYAKIKSGEDITAPSGEIIKPADAVLPSIPGRKIVILGDTRDSSRISSIAWNADVLVHEATLSNAMVEKCLASGHSTPAMAAVFAESISAKHLVLFHVTQRFKPLSEPLDDDEQSVEILVQEALEAGYTGHIVMAEDLDVITVQRKENVSAGQTEEMETARATDMAVELALEMAAQLEPEIVEEMEQEPELETETVTIVTKESSVEMTALSTKTKVTTLNV